MDLWSNDCQKMTRPFNRGKDNLLNKWSWYNWISTWKEMKLEPYLTPYTQNSLVVDAVNKNLPAKAGALVWEEAHAPQLLSPQSGPHKLQLLKLVRSRAPRLQLRSPCAATTEVSRPRAYAPLPEK